MCSLSKVGCHVGALTGTGTLELHGLGSSPGVSPGELGPVTFQPRVSAGVNIK